MGLSISNPTGLPTRHGGIQVAGTLSGVSASTFQEADGQVFYRGFVTFEKPGVGDAPERNPLLPGMVLQAAERNHRLTIDQYLTLFGPEIPRVPGTAVYLTADPEAIPTTLLHNLKHNKILHERIIVLQVDTRDVPRVPEAQRVDVERLGKGFYSVVAHYGFMEQPDVPAALRACRPHGIAYDEIRPGPNVTSDEDLRDFVRTRSWGHHASCTCPIGADDDPRAVLDSAFRVRGTTGLRVVLRDAAPVPALKQAITALGAGKGRIELVLELETLREVEIALPGRYPIAATTRTLLRNLQGVVEVVDL